ncbi:hypothetical protein ACFLT1_05110 [Bacteroidota bacterium]
MSGIMNISLENRLTRHLLFWAAWVFGFTFIKSFGASLHVYAGWFTYYIITLPIFIIHTYLVVYWAAENFLRGWRVPLFILIFFLLMMMFSFLDLLVTDELLSRYFPEQFPESASYLDLANIVISGVGNLYILLVFAAAKMIREWYVSDKHTQLLVERNLYLQRADVNAAVQPGMLLYTVGLIEECVSKRPEEVSAFLARLSELLNFVMQAHNFKRIRVDEEIRNVKKLLALYSMLLNRQQPQIRISGNELSLISLPVCIAFSPLEIICRANNAVPEESIELDIKSPDEIELSWHDPLRANDKDLEKKLTKEIEELYPDRFDIRYAFSHDTVRIRIRCCMKE